MDTRFDGPRGAVAALVQALDRADAASGGRLLDGIAAKEAYRAAVTVLMRLVVLAWAERYGPSLPGTVVRHAGNLFGWASDKSTPGAWETALAAFDAMYAATGSALFEEARFPFLRVHERGAPAASPVDDHTALCLRDAAVGYVAACAAPGDDPAVAEIGALYEALLTHTAIRAAEPLLALQATGRRTVMVPLCVLEATGAGGADALAAHMAGLTGRTERAVRRALASPGPSDNERLRAACGGDTLYRRICPFAPLLASAIAGRPAVVGAGRLYVAPSNVRRTHGAHYTPDDVAAEVVTSALEPLVYAGDGRPGTARQIHPAARLLELKVCDPAMGSGAFLLAACRYLADRVVESWTGHGAPSLPHAARARRALARRVVVTRCLYGVDLDPLAVDLARLALSFCAGAVSLPRLDHALRHGDALLGLAPGEEQGLDGDDADAASVTTGAAPWDRWLLAGTGRNGPAGSRRSQENVPAWLKADALVAARLAGAQGRRLDVVALLAGRHPFHWPLAFPEVFQLHGPDRQGGFDAVIGNPPFGNAVERATARDAAFNCLAAQCYDPFSRGANDYCLLFWGRALLHLLAPRGTYGLLGPTALLSDLKPWQAWVHAQARPTALISYPVDRFPAARVRVTAYCGRRGAASHVRVVDHDGEQRREAVAAWAGLTGCWYEAMTAPSTPPLPRATCPLADLPLSLHAGCTAGVAYELAPLVVDDEHGRGSRLVTTGAIGRYRCAWGQHPIRYLKRDYRFPRWPIGPDLPPGIERACVRQRSPKILLGGLTSVLEAVFDPSGELAGVVSTWVIRLGAAATMDAAYTLLAILNSATFSRLYTAQYGGKAMSGRQMTIQKAALLQMPCPLAVADALRALAAGAAAPGLATAPQQLATCRTAGRLLQTLSPGDPCWSQLDKAAHLAASLLYGRGVAWALDDYAWWCRQAQVTPDPTPSDALTALLETL